MNRAELIESIRETEKDLRAFKTARDSIQARIDELADQPSRQMEMLNWAGTQAVMNTLVLVTVRCEGLIEDYKKLLEQAPAPDNVVQLVRSEDDGCGE